MADSVRVLVAPQVAMLNAQVRRALPQVQQRTVGPFLFLDHMGPAEAPLHDVGPHPHIGLATVTYLVSGSMVHRDSLGTEQRIEAGALNWMTAGRGIVHSERDARGTLHGLQLWTAIPLADEECPPSFDHYPANSLPTVSVPGAEVRVVVGHAFGATSPARVGLPTLLVDLRVDGNLALDVLAEEQALYVLDGEALVDGQSVAVGQLAVLPGRAVNVEGRCRAVLLGGGKLAEHRFLLWNFASSRKERLRQAAEDWAALRFPLIPGDQAEHVAIPGRFLVGG